MSTTTKFTTGAVAAALITIAISHPIKLETREFLWISTMVGLLPIRTKSTIRGGARKPTQDSGIVQHFTF